MVTASPARLTASTRSALAVNVLRHVDVGVAHVVPDHLRPCTLPQHQAGLHGTEAPKIYGVRESQLDRGSLDMTQQVAPAHRTAFASSKHQVIALPVLARVPSSNQG